MRAVLLISVALVFAVVCVEETSAISFDDLVSRAEEARHPKPHRAPPPPDPDMEEWSTDHLLGLDQPPPTDMFDSLIHKAKKKTMVKPHKVIKKVEQKVKVTKTTAPKKHHKRTVHKKVHRVRGSTVAADLLSAIPATHHRGHSITTHVEEKHKVSRRNQHKPAVHMIESKKTRRHSVQMVTTDIEDPAEDIRHTHKKKLRAHKEVHSRHNSHKKHSRRPPSILGSIGRVHKDKKVPEQSEFEEALVNAHDDMDEENSEQDAGLSGLAGSMLRESESRDKVKANKKAKTAKKDDEDEDEDREDHGVHLDLSGDDSEEDPDEPEKNLPSLESFFDDDDEDDMP